MTTKPISFTEYTKEVKDRFINTSSDLSVEEKTNILNDFLKESPNFMKIEYGTSMSIYNQNINTWQELGMSEEEILERFLSYPIRNLRLILDFD